MVPMLEIVEHEIITCLALLGASGWPELDGSYLHPAPAVGVAHTLGAFPLLTLDEKSFY
ncbi:MAG: hypothetical protein ACREQN_08990 [Candidatus Binataceae bacterium]